MVVVPFGLSVTGNCSPEIENPVPVTLAPLTVTAAVPVELNVMLCAIALFTGTVPNAMLDWLRLRVGTLVPISRAKVFARSPELAVIVTVCAVLVAVAVKLKLALFWPDATVTDAGTITAALLLERLTASPLLSAAAFSVTVQISEPDPVIDPVAQVRPFTIGTPIPVKLTLRAWLSDELLLSDNCPVVVPEAVGSNSTLTLAVWPGLSVNGKLAPEATYPVPETVAPLTVTAAVPVDERVNDCVAAELTSTLPKSRVPVLMVNAAVTGFNCTEKSSVIFPASAVKVTVAGVVTALAVAVKFALVAPAATVTEDGTLTALLLLARFTTCPLSPAGALSITVQSSAVDPVIELLVQLNEVSVVVVTAVAPVPLNPTCRELAPLALLEMVSCPVAVPVADGLNWMVNVNVLLGLTLAGSPLWVVTLNDCPLTAIWETSTGADPSLVTVTLVLALWPIGTEPNVTDCVDAVSVPVTEALLDDELPIPDVQPLSMRPHNDRPSSSSFSRRALSLPTQKKGWNTLQKRAKVTI